MAFEGRSAGWFGCSQGIWSKTPGTQVQHRLIEAAARRRNGGNTGFSRAPPSAVSLTFHNLPGVFDHVPALRAAPQAWLTDVLEWMSRAGPRPTSSNSCCPGTGRSSVTVVCGAPCGSADDDEDRGPRRYSQALLLCVLMVLRPVRATTASAGSR